MVDTIWLEALRQLRGALAAKDYEFWIGPLRAVRWEAHELTLEVASPFARDWIAREYLALIARAVGLAAGCEARVGLVVNRQLAATVPARRAPLRVVPETSGSADAEEVPRYSFDSFVVGDSNAVAYRAAREIVEKPGQRFNPLFVHGGFGLGKTHLLSAIGHELRRDKRQGGVAILTAEQFVNEMILALRRDQMDRFRHRYRGIGTLIVDDVQFLGGKKRSQEEFAHTFNALHGLRKQIVLASDRPPHELADMQDTLRNRFASGLLVDILPPEAPLRSALVEQKARRMGLTLQGAVARYLTTQWCDNVRELEGALTRLAALESLCGRPLTLAAAREALAPYLRPARSNDRVSVARIVGEVCRQYQVTRAELASPRRTARLSVPRQVAMYLARRHTEAPLDAIGAELGGRDHSTVLYALEMVERRLGSDAALRSAVATLEARIAG